MGARPFGGGAGIGPSSSARWWSDSVKVEAKSATEEYERLAAGELAELRVGLIHGQMPPAAREEAMSRFRAGEVQVLVATTVIEVGVDVPEATVMVIESADRFGIAQLHQLRGRVGRGTDPSWCFLLGGEAGNDRLAAVAASTDGFALAETDLRLRGEGTLLGARQKGQSDLKLASLSDEGDLQLLSGGAGRGPGGGRRGPAAGVAPGPGRRGAAAAQRGRGRVPLQELTVVTERTRRRGARRGRPPGQRLLQEHGFERPMVGAMRVIGGRSRGRRLSARLPPTVRPTSDRVRESIFDILGSRGGVEGLRVVDLFCGSGALGVEALSRGAASVTFVDSDPTRSTPCGRTSTPSDWVRRRSRWCVPSCRAGCGGPSPRLDVHVRPRPVRPALRLHPVVRPARCAGRRHGRHGVLGSGRARPGLGEHEGAPVRRYARHRGSSQRCRLVKVGLFPGSFDPFHNGHLEIVERASRLFDEVVVAALRNPQKSKPLFDLEERQAMLEQVTAHLPSVRIVSVSTLLVYVARDVSASAIVRGLRAVSDFETEMQMAQMNNHLSGVETIFIPTSSKYSFVASKLVREVARFGGDVSAFVPEVVAKALRAKYEEGRGER